MNRSDRIKLEQAKDGLASASAALGHAQQRVTEALARVEFLLAGERPRHYDRSLRNKTNGSEEGTP